MECPKCPGTLQEKTYGRKIKIHRCSACGGLWCKPDTLLEMKREWMSEAVLDSGDPRLGQQLNRLDDINCPECGVKMDKTFDDKQVHIWYETCSACDGLFLDAGEFSDLKYDTFMDRLRDLVRGRRPGEDE